MIMILLNESDYLKVLLFGSKLWTNPAMDMNPSSLIRHEAGHLVRKTPINIPPMRRAPELRG